MRKFFFFFQFVLIWFNWVYFVGSSFFVCSNRIHRRVAFLWCGYNVDAMTAMFMDTAKKVLQVWRVKIKSCRCGIVAVVIVSYRTLSLCRCWSGRSLHFLYLLHVLHGADWLGALLLVPLVRISTPLDILQQHLECRRELLECFFSAGMSPTGSLPASSSSSGKLPLIPPVRVSTRCAVDSSARTSHSI